MFLGIEIGGTKLQLGVGSGDSPELAAMVLAVILVNFMVQDGESNWLEGAMALGAYVIIGLGFYYL